jgi:hypothetical protein
VEERGPIFSKISYGRIGLSEWMPIDMNPVQYLVFLVVPFSLRTNDRNLVATLIQRLCFLPDPTIKRNGQVLNQD